MIVQFTFIAAGHDEHMEGVRYLYKLYRAYNICKQTGQVIKELKARRQYSQISIFLVCRIEPPLYHIKSEARHRPD